MKYAIEFPYMKRSPNFDRVLAICRRLPGFVETFQNGEPLYTIHFEADEIESVQAVLDYVKAWQTAAFYIDGRLVPRFTIVREIGDRIMDDYMERRRLQIRRRDVEKKIALGREARETQKKIREARTPGDIVDHGR